jgi:hypothetical protein
MALETTKTTALDNVTAFEQLLIPTNLSGSHGENRAT